MKFKIISLIICLFTLCIIEAQTRFKSLNYLYQISGDKILSGQHNDQKPYNGQQTDASYWTEEIKSVTGKYPALYGVDLLFHGNDDMRWEITYEAVEQWNKGAIINMMWHACPPTQSEPCNWDGGIKSSLSSAQWVDLLTDGGTLNEVWKDRIDQIAAPYLQYLKDRGVEVLWRPFHEQNQTVFWWNSGTAEDTKALWALTHDYMTKELGLTNLIWTWDVQDIHSNFAQYNPGDNYFDLAALDIYGNGFYDLSYYNALNDQANGKPIAFGECFTLPSESVINQQANMSFFMCWAYGLYVDVNGNTTNTIQHIIDVYNNPKVITLDEMPGWDATWVSRSKTIIDFEEIPYIQGGWNGSSEVTDNPQLDGTNSSAVVCKYTTPPNKTWTNCAWVIFENDISYQDLDYIEFDVLAPSTTTMYVKLENEDIEGETQIESYATPISSSTWQTIRLDFSEISGEESSSATFNKLAFFFNVNDAVGNEDWYYDNVVVHTNTLNSKPIADAGMDQIVAINDRVTLNASASYDTDGDQLSYTWNAPPEINLDLSNPIKPTFTCPNVLVDTEYEISLTVNDGFEDSEVDKLIIKTQITTVISKNQTIEYSIYPNPTVGIVYINLNKSADVEVLTMGGKRIVKAKAREGRNQINLQAYPPGIYLLRLSNDDVLVTDRVILK